MTGSYVDSRGASSKLVEFFILTLTLASTCCLWFLGLLTLPVAIWLTSLFLIALVFLCWYRFDGGLHPVFLFMGLLLVFQGGRLLGYITGAVDDPFQIELQTWVPFNVHPDTKFISLFVVAFSALVIYLSCRLFYRKNISESNGKHHQYLRVLYLFFLFTFPFLVIKDVLYLRYMMAHGGYYAIYTDYEGVVSSAGVIVRTLGAFATSAFLLIYLIETNPRRLTIVTSLYLLGSVGDLLMGYRGKVYTLVLMLWYLRNLKRGKPFPLRTMLIAGFVMTTVGVVIVAFREQHAVQYLNPMAFLAQQGISFNVTECAIEYRHAFERYGASYLLHDLTAAFVPVMEAKDGQFIARDLSLFLNPFSFEQGAGTGSDYLAQLYVAGAIRGVFLGSLFVGFLFVWLQRIGKELWGQIVMVCIGQSLIYIPRGGLLEPFSQGVKVGLPILALLWIADFWTRHDSHKQLSAQHVLKA